MKFRAMFSKDYQNIISGPSKSNASNVTCNRFFVIQQLTFSLVTLATYTSHVLSVSSFWWGSLVMGGFPERKGVNGAAAADGEKNYPNKLPTQYFVVNGICEHRVGQYGSDDLRYCQRHLHDAIDDHKGRSGRREILRHHASAPPAVFGETPN